MSKSESRPADFERLPARFKRYILEIESQLHALRQAQASQEPTRISIRPLRLRTGEEESGATYLPESEAVRFRLEGLDHDIEVRLAKDCQRIELRGWRQLRVYPKSANEVQIDESPDW